MRKWKVMPQEMFEALFEEWSDQARRYRDHARFVGAMFIFAVVVGWVLAIWAALSL